MKNDIDSILESMFRGGRLHFKSSVPEKEEQAASSAGALAQAEAGSREAQQALDAVTEE